MGHPFFDELSYPWNRPEAVLLWQALTKTIANVAAIDLIYKQCAEALPPLPQGIRPDMIWKEALENLANASALRKLCDIILADTSKRPIHPVVQKVVDAEAVTKEKLLPGAGAVASVAPRSGLITSTLSAPHKTLFGREQESRDACAFLQRDDVQLLTLVGPSGVGKTHLAMEVASRLYTTFADGIFFVALDTVPGPEQVAPAIADALGVKEVSQRPLTESIKAFLHDKRLLLVLDQFEHVAKCKLLVVDLLRAAPQVKVLITSRLALDLAEGQELPVGPLPVPNLDHLPPSLVELASNPSVALFVTRVQSFQPTFTLTAEEAPAIAEICVASDGLPLAIILYASKIRFFTPRPLLERLKKQLPLPGGGPPGIPVRHRTMSEAIASSYDLLTERDKNLFRRLGIFAGGFGTDAAETVCGVPDVIDGLASLVMSSLLHLERNPVGQARFSMLRPLREYAVGRLADAGEKEILQQRHAEFYLRLAEEAEQQLQSSSQLEWVARLEAELDNLRAALSWSLTSPNNAEVGLRIAAALGWFWLGRDRRREGFEWLERVLTHLSSAGSSRAKALFAAGLLAWGQGAYQRSNELFEQSMAIYEGQHDTVGVALAKVGLGRTVGTMGNYQRAEQLEKEALDLLRDDADVWRHAWTVISLGDALFAQGHKKLSQAARRYSEVLTLSRHADIPEIEGWALVNLGRIEYIKGHWDDAEALLKQGLAHFQSVVFDMGIEEVLLELANVAYMKRDIPEATRLYWDSLRRNWARGGMLNVVNCLAGLCGIAAANQRFSAAARLAGVVEAQLAAINAALRPTVRTVYEDAVQQARTQLGHARWEKARSEGRWVEMEELVVDLLKNGTLDSLAI